MIRYIEQLSIDEQTALCLVHMAQNVGSEPDAAIDGILLEFAAARAEPPAFIVAEAERRRRLDA